MGWFDEQIKQRIKNDDDIFADAFASLADVVMGEKLSRALSDSRIQTKNAIDEILRFYRVKPKELPDSISDINDQLEYLLWPNGIMRRTVVLRGAWYQDGFGAMLTVRKDDGTPVALLPNGFSGYSFIDSKTGKQSKLDKKSAQIIDDEAICFYRPLPLKKITTRDLWKYMFASVTVYDAAAIGAMALAAAIVGLLLPAINNIIYAHVVTENSIQLLYAVFSFLICISVSQLLFNAVKALAVLRIGNKISNSVHTAAMMRLLSLNAAFFKKYNAGELARNIYYIGQASSIMITTVLTTGISAFFPLIYITQMIKYGANMVIPGLLVILFAAALLAISTFAEIKSSLKTVDAMSKEEGLTHSLIMGIQKIKLSGAEKRAFAQWAKAYRVVTDLRINSPSVITFNEIVSSCIELIGMIIIYFFAIKTKTSTADYFAFNAAYAMIIGSFTAFSDVSHTTAQIKPMFDSIKPILEAIPDVAQNKNVITRISGGLELNNVSFRYAENMPKIINNFSLTIPSGQYVAIVGASGCGKSTLMRLMLGFEKPQKGAIYYDGKDIAGIDLKSLRKHIGTVMQDEKLFSGDIFSNITISAPHLTMDDAWEAAEMAGAAEEIKNMPMGMHTLISEGSGGISGGQRQRLIIARAIAQKPKLLMLDEATSALDNITQKIVSDSLTKLRCTKVVIAHRLSTIKQCDRIIVLDQGKIAGDGTYDELVKSNGIFAQLVARQTPDMLKY